MQNRKNHSAGRKPMGVIPWLFVRVVCLTVMMGLSSRTLQGQTVTGTVQGTITDGTGAIVPGVAVTATNMETNVKRTVASNEVGFYAFPNLVPGRYRLEMTIAGFQTAVHEGVALAVGQQLVLNTSLQVGEMTQQVTVSAEALGISTTATEISGVVSPSRVAELPLLSRDFRDLQSLLPGVIPIPASYTTGGVVGTTTRNLRISIGGGRTSASAYYLDGLFINTPDGMAPKGVTGNQLGTDFVREFRVITNNYTAEYGRAGSGVINIVTNSGTNVLHGSVFEFLRNDKLNARNFFDIPNKNPLRRNQFGFSLGGPIRKDTTFFFLSGEGLRERENIPMVTRVPDLNARRGLLPDVQGNLVAIPNLIGDRAVQAVMDLYPLPTGRSFGDGSAESNVPFSVPTRDDIANLRIDRTLTANHNLFARYTFNDGVRTIPGGQPTFLRLARIRNQWISLQENWVATPSLVNMARFGFVRVGERSSERPAEGTKIDRDIVIIPTRFDVASISIANFGITGQRLSGDVEGETFTSLQFSDDVVSTRARHTIKFGVRFERYHTDFLGGRLNAESNALGSGIWTFLRLEDLFAGRARDLRDSVGIVPEGNAHTIANTYMAGYVQDEYRILSNLTLNIGLRWEHLTPPLRNPAVSSLTNWFSDSLPQLKKYLYETSSVLAPRVGLAWSPLRRDPTFAVRVAGGIFYDHLGAGFYRNGMRLNWPYNTQSSMSGASFPNPYPRGALDFLPPSAAASVPYPPHVKVPTIYQFNLSLSKAFTDRFQVMGAYAGSQGRHLTSAKSLNNYPRTIVNGRVFYDKTGPLANPNYRGDIKPRMTDGMSYYHSLQLSLKSRLTGSSALDWSYTYSKCMDTSSQENTSDFGGLSETFVYDGHNMRNERALCVMDIRQRLAMNLVYELPFFKDLHGLGKALLEGWSISSIVQVSDGAPFTQRVTFPRSLSQLAASNARQERPDLAPGVDLSDKSNLVFPGSPDRYYDPTMFVLQPEGFLGNAGRSLIVGPGLVTADLAISKAVPLKKEGVELKFRAEFFNLFNRANFGLPEFQVFTNTTGQHNPAAGRISNTSTSSRQVQFALKLVF